MDIELKELSNIYLQTLKEEEDGAAGEGQNPQQSEDVGAHAKAIRYQARRDNVPLPKAFNDYVSKNQLSGTERTALRQKLGFMGEEVECNNTKEGEECPVHGMKACPVDEEEHKIGGGNLKKLSSKANKRVDADVDGDVDTKDMKSGETGEFVPGPDGKKVKSKFRAEHVSWRTDLSEYVGGNASPKAKTDDKSREKITEKKVKNKIVINPPQGMTEAIEELGGQILEMVEIEEAVYGGTPKKKEEPEDTRMTVTNADKKANTPAYQKMMAGDKRYKKADHMDEEAAGDKKAEAMRKKQLASREQMMKKQHLLDKQRMQAQKSLRIPSGHMEGLSVDDQMKISQDYNRKSPEEKLAANKKALGTIKKVKREKDTRTDAQKMTDATGPRPGSRYRGD